MRTRALALLLVLAVPNAALAGPWTPRQGHGYAKLWMKWLWGIGYVDGEGDFNHYARYYEVFFATYGDVGLADTLALFWHTDLLRVFTLEDPRSGERQAHVAPGDPALGLRWQFLHLDRYVMSLSASVRAPLADDEPVQEVFTRKEPYTQLGDLQTGLGVWQLSTKLEAGYGWDSVYVAAGIGYQARFEGFDDRILWSAEVGWTGSRTWGGRVRLSGAHSIDEGGAPRSNSPSGIGNGVSYAGFAVEMDRRLSESWFAGLTIEGGLPGLRRQTGGPVISLSVSTQY